MARPGIRGLGGTEVESMVTAFVSRIYEHFENVSDPRVKWGLQLSAARNGVRGEKLYVIVQTGWQRGLCQLK